MKTGPFTPKPGDLFSWYYDTDDTPCHSYDQLFSMSMRLWVPCAGVNTLISLTNSNIFWLNDTHIFNARIDNTSPWPNTKQGRSIYPRKLT